MMDNEDGLDIPEFLRRDKWERRQGWRKIAHVRHRRKAAKERRFSLYAQQRAARKRARFEWR